MSETLYRKYRSTSLDEIIGQKPIINILKRSLETNNTSHAYLFTGPRGVGKTSIARIFAFALNNVPYTTNQTYTDIIEIDAASNNSVEDIRELRERVGIAPSQLSKKIYIIDEVHMLSKSAFNALLKTLEEPPKHIVFILATTDVDKLPATILSRVQRFNFSPISSHDIFEHLKTIAFKEKIKINDSALKILSEQSDGSMRDGLSLLDQIRSISDGAIDADDVTENLGLVSSDTINSLIKDYLEINTDNIFKTLKNIEAKGYPPKTVIAQLIDNLYQSNNITQTSLGLLKQLVTNSFSQWPYIKLLTIFTDHSSSSIKQQLSSKRSIKQQIEPTIDTPKEPKTPKTTVPSKDSKKHKTETEKVTNQEIKDSKTPNRLPTELDWQSYLDRVKITSLSTFTLLQKSDFEIDSTTLTIFAGTKFAKTQLEKNRSIIIDTLSGHISIEDFDIVIIDKRKPPKDPEAAKIIDIMGGGEEVSI